jgi:transcriptional regulator with XRE-family HTH domain
MKLMTQDVEKIRRTLSKNLKKYRALAGVSQEKLADATELSDQLIRDIEGCRTWVSDKTVVKLARALNIEVYRLFFPELEADKLHPVRVSADVLRELKEAVFADMEKRFSEVVKE